MARFSRRKARASPSGAVIIGLAAFLPGLRRAADVRFDWLLPLGLLWPIFASYDYFPLIPWFGVFLAGAALGKTVYAPGKSLLLRPPRETFINFAGRHSLLIYVVHQPVIMGILYLLG